MRWYTSNESLIASNNLDHKIFYGSVTEMFHARSGLKKDYFKTQEEAIAWCESNDKNIGTI